MKESSSSTRTATCRYLKTGEVIGLCLMSLNSGKGAPTDCMTVSDTADRVVAGWWTDWRPDSDWLIQALQFACHFFSFFFSSTRLSLAYRGRPFR